MTASDDRLGFKSRIIDDPAVLAASSASCDQCAPSLGLSLLGEDGGCGSVVEVVLTVPFEDAGEEF
ncbi:hypothetical protein, partial [Gordonia humi]|uniref:hypothetical protein n=1 Tax=Gordonia humi TaxID=686429 RepID=UPI0036104CD5